MDKRIKILVRRNVTMSANKTAAQAVHAALGARDTDPIMSVVVLTVSDKKFNEKRASLTEGGVDHHVVEDAGYTEVPPGAVTCLAFREEDVVR